MDGLEALQPRNHLKIEKKWRMSKSKIGATATLNVDRLGMADAVPMADGLDTTPSARGHRRIIEGGGIMAIERKIHLCYLGAQITYGKADKTGQHWMRSLCGKLVSPAIVQGGPW